MPQRAGRQAETPKLSTYRAKRDFGRTPEPSGQTAPQPASGRRLIVQKHFARREHFDLRLEIDGALASWAITRGPSANPSDKRLAVRTEDHPLDYGAFEGTIAPGNYGAGAVLLWESATYEPRNGDPAKALKNGELKFLAQGERMGGEWVLVRLPKKPKDNNENWLLIKHRDAFAEDDDSLARRYQTSIVSARDREDVEAGRAARKAKPKPAPPAFRPPCLCESAKTVPSDAGWLYEMKYDGYRLQIAVAGGGATVYTRSGLDWSKRFPGLVAEARRLPCKTALLDGEAVVFDDHGVSDFPALVSALETGRSEKIVFVAFDLLERDGKDLAPLPLRKRKALLRDLLPEGSRLRVAKFLEARGAEMFKSAVEAGAEGIVAKRADAPYRAGRTPDWLEDQGGQRGGRHPHRPHALRQGRTPRRPARRPPRRRRLHLPRPGRNRLQALARKTRAENRGAAGAPAGNHRQRHENPETRNILANPRRGRSRPGRLDRRGFAAAGPPAAPARRFFGPAAPPARRRRVSPIADRVMFPRLRRHQGRHRRLLR